MEPGRPEGGRVRSRIPRPISSDELVLMVAVQAPTDLLPGGSGQVTGPLRCLGAELPGLLSGSGPQVARLRSGGPRGRLDRRVLGELPGRLLDLFVPFPAGPGAE